MSYDINLAIDAYSHSMGNREEALAEHHCTERAPVVNSDGIAALLRWVVWMAWHEGCLR